MKVRSPLATFDVRLGTVGRRGNSLILRNESHGNRYGMFVSNSSGTAWVGSLDLAAGDGNRVHDNLGAGLSVQNGGVHAAGNTVYGHTASGQIGLSVSSGAQASSNLVYDNTIGIDAFGSTISNNRVYHNTGTGIQASQSSLLGNVVYSNARASPGMAGAPMCCATTWCMATARTALQSPATPCR